MDATAAAGAVITGCGIAGTGVALAGVVAATVGAAGAFATTFEAWALEAGDGVFAAGVGLAVETGVCVLGVTLATLADGVFVGTDFRTTFGDAVSDFVGSLAGVFFTSLGVAVVGAGALRREDVPALVESLSVEGDVKIRRDTCGTSSTVGAAWLGSITPGPTRRLLREIDSGSGRVPTELLREATSLAEPLILRGVELAIGGGFGKSAGVAGARRTILGWVVVVLEAGAPARGSRIGAARRVAVFELVP